MSIVDRAKNILQTPKTEWPVIAAEPATEKGLFTGYAVPMALLPVAGSILAGLLFLHGFLGVSLVTALFGYVIGLAILFLMGLVADALAPSFDGQKSRIGGMKLVVYAATGIWVAGFFQFIPAIGPILSLVGFAWSAYLMYLGCQSVMRVPESKAIGYTAVLIIIWIVLGMIVSGLIVGAVVASFLTTGLYRPF